MKTVVTLFILLPISYKGTRNDFNGIMQIQHPPLPIIVSDDLGVL